MSTEAEKFITEIAVFLPKRKQLELINSLHSTGIKSPLRNNNIEFINYNIKNEKLIVYIKILEILNGVFFLNDVEILELFRMVFKKYYHCHNVNTIEKAVEPIPIECTPVNMENYNIDNFLDFKENGDIVFKTEKDDRYYGLHPMYNDRDKVFFMKEIRGNNEEFGLTSLSLPDNHSNVAFFYICKTNSVIMNGLFCHKKHGGYIGDFMDYLNNNEYKIKHSELHSIDFLSDYELLKTNENLEIITPYYKYIYNYNSNEVIGDKYIHKSHIDRIKSILMVHNIKNPDFTPVINKLHKKHSDSLDERFDVEFKIINENTTYINLFDNRTDNSYHRPFLMKENKLVHKICDSNPKNQYLLKIIENKFGSKREDNI